MRKKVSIFFTLGILSFIFFKCSMSEKVKIEGVATDLKAGAAVMTEKDGGYYLDGMDFWPKDIRGKKIKIKGKLKVQYDTLRTDPLIVPQSAGKMKIIENYKYEIMK